MDFNKLPIIQAITARMDWLNQRQSVLSTNLANSDTANYTPRDLRPLDFREALQGASGAGPASAPASSRHQANMDALQSGTALSGSRRKGYGQYDAKGIETTPSGNSVVLEEQLIKVAETQLEYTAMTNLYRKQVDLIRLAVSRR